MGEKTTWTDERLQRLFQNYNRKFWKGQLAGWIVNAEENHYVAQGYCNRKTKCISVRWEAHRTDMEVRATLVHEMAHAASSVYHGRVWRNEMGRLKKAGAPTSPLDFLVPYTARKIVTTFMDAAYSGDSWEETVAEMGGFYELCHMDGTPVSRRAARILQQCKKFFLLAAASAKSARQHTSAKNPPTVPPPST